MNPRIQISPTVCHGKPVIRGTRVRVSTVLGALSGADSVATVLDDLSPGAEWLIERGYDPRLARKVHKEYFAEATEAYFYRNDFHPFVRAELLKHDPAGHAEMVRAWQK